MGENNHLAGLSIHDLTYASKAAQIKKISKLQNMTPKRGIWAPKSLSTQGAHALRLSAYDRT